ncbi:hypothetical protein [Siphonobacter sp. SORGH_AS_1065]|uniref:hypothetical protein n=1 Tax=Siphonobacter sp. SORGH_AS_1065 TaxID=3041795 RepID=UPI00278B8C5E|nr:hypothetical protein [Siphonobacter sp. SORGH_AS_1065]MDQ1085635.1 hypothetical protein [Siphonobacter sp. SORGH_AS_1065]
MDLLQLKSDYQFAEMCHNAHGTELTGLNLKNAKEAYEKALADTSVKATDNSETEPVQSEETTPDSEKPQVEPTVPEVEQEVETEEKKSKKKAK